METGVFEATTIHYAVAKRKIMENTDEIMEAREEITYIDCTKDDLRKFARGEILYNKLIKLEDDVHEYWNYWPRCTETYEMTFQDLRQAIENMLKQKRTADDFFYGWHEQITSTIPDMIGLAKLMGHPDMDPSDVLYELEAPLFPKNKAQLCLSLFNDMDFDEGQYAACMMEEEEFAADLEEYLERMNNIEFNMMHHISEWKFTDRQKEQIILYFEEEKNLRKAGTEKQKLFKNVLEELCEAGNLRAIQIKGYACYGDGNPVYPCDWVVSRDCMLQLVEHGNDHMQAQSANTLGYIYYYGRCNNGVPEYDLAYKYFSLASFFGFYEASYKVGDMLAGGKGIPKNKEAAYRLYEEVYVDCYRKFQAGDKHQTLADAALRMGGAYQNGIGVYPNLMIAYTYYLQAKLAIDIRMRHSDFFGNRKVLAGIEKGLEETRLELMKEEKDVTKSTMMLDIKRILDNLGYDPYGSRMMTMEIQNDDDVIRLKFKRRKRESYDPNPKIMITIPEVSYCKRTNQVVLQCPKDIEINVKKDAKKVSFNEIKVGSDYVKLYLDGKRKVTIHCKEMLFDSGEQK